MTTVIAEEFMRYPLAPLLASRFFEHPRATLVPAGARDEWIPTLCARSALRLILLHARARGLLPGCHRGLRGVVLRLARDRFTGDHHAVHGDAGARRVVVSLWNVNDKATASLMQRLYTEMLRSHKTPAAALRAAQIEMLRTRQWQSPYFWAAFVMQGEWK